MTIMDIGKEIKDIRVQFRLSQEEFGNILHESKQTISNWEANKTRPSYESMVKMDQIYGTKFTYLNNKENDKKEFIPESKYLIKEFSRYCKYCIDHFTAYNETHKFDNEIKKWINYYDKINSYWYYYFDYYLTGHFEMMRKAQAVDITIWMMSGDELIERLEVFNNIYEICDFKPLSLQELDEIYKTG